MIVGKSMETTWCPSSVGERVNMRLSIVIAVLLVSALKNTQPMTTA